MSDRLSRRLGGHLRRHGIAYAALTAALSFSPLPSMAADLVTTGDIANGAVTTPKLAGDAVTSAKIDNGAITKGDLQNGSVSEAKVVPLEWQPLSLSTGWTNGSGGDLRPASWAIDVQGVVHLRGAIYGGATIDIAQVPLPRAARPASGIRLLAAQSGLGQMQYTHLYISPSGEIFNQLTNVEGDPVEVSLEGLSWTTK
jgi:hypothetical protein